MKHEDLGELDDFDGDFHAKPEDLDGELRVKPEDLCDRLHTKPDDLDGDLYAQLKAPRRSCCRYSWS